MVRPGVLVPGLWPSEDVTRRIEVRPVLSLITHVAQVKEVPAGRKVSYGCTYTTGSPSVLATLPLGYHDGYRRGFSNRAAMLVAGVRAPVRGRVCMDQTVIDVSAVPGVRTGDAVVAMGHWGAETVSADELAGHIGTIGYEIATTVGRRVPRLYVHGGRPVRLTAPLGEWTVGGWEDLPWPDVEATYLRRGSLADGSSIARRGGGLGGSSMPRRPLIGIMPGFEADRGLISLRPQYAFGVAEVGGAPVILPVPGVEVPEEQWLDTLDHLDGLLVSGGPDLDPMTFGEAPVRGLGSVSPERDRFELTFVRAALERDLPLLGICRGIQTVAVAAGGTLIQDVNTQFPGVIKHRQDAPYWHTTHFVRLAPASQIATIHAAEQIMVNSFHHQAVRELPYGFVATAWAPDGLIEAMESTRHRMVLGVQWHPEGIWPVDRNHLAVFRHLVQAATGRG